MRVFDFTILNQRSHELISRSIRAGQLSTDHMRIALPDDFDFGGEEVPQLRLALEPFGGAQLKTQPQKEPHVEIANLSQPEIDSRFSTCISCEWNVNWICEHSGCLPCAQRKVEGGLKMFLRLPNYHCPQKLF